MQIRTFKFPQDFQQVLHLWENSGPGVHLGYSDTEQEIERKIEYAPDLFLVASVENQIIGTVLAGYDGRRGLIYHLAVDAGFRHQGIGTELMQEIENRLRELGCYKVYLLIMHDHREVIDFYRNRGWDLMPVTTMGKELK